MAIVERMKGYIGAALLFGVVAFQPAVAAPIVTVTASPNSVAVGGPLGVDIAISAAVDLYAFQFSLVFNPVVLNAKSVAEGPFLATGGTTFFDGGTIDNTAGTISFVFDTLIGAVPGVNGNGILAHVNFGSVKPGSSALTLTDALFLNSNFDELAVQLQNATVRVVPEPGSLLLLVAACGAGAWFTRRRGAHFPAAGSVRLALH